MVLMTMTMTASTSVWNLPFPAKKRRTEEQMARERTHGQGNPGPRCRATPETPSLASVARRSTPRRTQERAQMTSAVVLARQVVVVPRANELRQSGRASRRERPVGRLHPTCASEPLPLLVFLCFLTCVVLYRVSETRAAVKPKIFKLCTVLFQKVFFFFLVA